MEALGNESFTKPEKLAEAEFLVGEEVGVVQPLEMLNSFSDSVGGKEMKAMLSLLLDKPDLGVQALIVKAAKFEESDLQRGTHGRRLPPDCL